MRDKADQKKLDLILIDTGDLHDGNGLSDATSPNGEVTNPIFENIDYDILTPGNHELIAADVAFETFTKFAKVYGDKYLTSNIDICSNCQDGQPDNKTWESMGKRYRYFKTKQGIRIMSFGVILDGTNNNKDMTRIQPAQEMIEESWFKDALKRDDIDLFVLIGHNPVKPGIPKSESSFPLLMDTIRKARPSIPVQGFGGHTHRRDFHIYDPMSSAIESGKYCDTVGWVTLDDIKPKAAPARSHNTEAIEPVPLVNQATNVNLANSSCTKTKSFSMKLSRRWLDWNRLTFAYHATGSQDTFNTASGTSVSKKIEDARKDLSLNHVYGCAPRSYCISCKPPGDEGNIYTLVQTAAAATVVNSSRAMNPRMIIVNNGAIRYDLVKGPFTLDDSYIVCPYTSPFKYIGDVPYSIASKVLDIMTKAKSNTTPKRSMTIDTTSSQMMGYDECDNISPFNSSDLLKPKSLFGRVLESSTPTPGYTTCDDLGDDGDDTPHTAIPEHAQPYYIQGEAAFPSDGTPETVDIIFSDFLDKAVISALNSQNPAKNYSKEDTSLYMPKNFTTNSFIPKYAETAWQANINNCTVE
ncbi:hypothetical protein N7478_002309 [Penicillium angulare]|uniref:uncharacterized protein n=1 Tax=Penicillium angulare TaxID=116970 RepID=UPI0025409120|nr:uncharacterized protein N7478_002309 [Penicillium angulare]KAJ5286623.1 hypothetical protein N7478_002309 [Penicillium angulare]